MVLHFDFIPYSSKNSEQAHLSQYLKQIKSSDCNTIILYFEEFLHRGHCQQRLRKCMKLLFSYITTPIHVAEADNIIQTKDET